MNIYHLLYKGSSYSDTVRLTSDTLVMLNSNRVVVSPFSMVGMDFSADASQSPANVYPLFAQLIWENRATAKKSVDYVGWEDLTFLPCYCTSTIEAVSTVDYEVVTKYGRVLLHNGSPVYHHITQDFYIWRESSQAINRWVAAKKFSTVALTSNTAYLFKPGDMVIPNATGNWTKFIPAGVPGNADLPVLFSFYFVHHGSEASSIRTPLNITLSLASVKAKSTVLTCASNYFIANDGRYLQ